MTKLSDKTLFSGTLVGSDRMHVVDVSDTTDGPGGTSFGATLDKLNEFFGAAGIITGTLAEILTLRNNGTLSVKHRYLTNNLTATQGFEILFTPADINRLSMDTLIVGQYADYNNDGTYTGVEGFTGTAFTDQYGQWYSALESTLGNGDVVIYDSRHYQVVNDADLNGTNPTLNLYVSGSGAYLLLPLTTANVGYIKTTAVFQIEIPDGSTTLPTTTVKYLQDGQSNYLAGGLVGTLRYFQFGSSRQNRLVNGVLNNINCVVPCHQNEVIQSTVNLSGSRGAFSQNRVRGHDTDYAVISAVLNNGVSVENCTFDITSKITITLPAATSRNGKTFKQGVYSDFDIEMDADTTLDVDFTGLTGGTFTLGDLVEDTGTGATATVLSLAGATVTLKNVIGKFTDGNTLSNITTSQTATIDGQPAYPSYDLTAANNFIGDFTLDSTEIGICIGDFNNTPATPFIIRPASNKHVTLVDSSTLRLAGGQTAILVGDSGDWIKFEVRNGIAYQIGGEVYTTIYNT